MKIRPPSKNDLYRLANENHMELNDEELEVFESLMKPMVKSFDKIFSIRPTNGSSITRDISILDKPSCKEDPFNAIIRRCVVSGSSNGKLAGKRIGLKDNISVAGIPLTCGSTVLDGFVPDDDATIVTRILGEGGKITAILNMDDFAYSGAGAISAYGPILNPHNTHYLAGGSSGGSAASLYYDYVDMTIGCDQGGSIRMPASWCGVVGLKPTFGLVPYTGIVGADATIDHAGPMARNVEDVALLLEVIAGNDHKDPRQIEFNVESYVDNLSKNISGLRIGLVREGFGLKISDPEVDTSVRNALTVLGDLGADIKEVSIPEHRDIGKVIAWAIAAEGGAMGLRENGVGYHSGGHHNVALANVLGKSRITNGNDFPPSVKIMLLLGTYLNQTYHGSVYGRAQNAAKILRDSYDRAFQQVDMLAMPTTPMKAHKYRSNASLSELMEYSSNMSGNTAPTNITGHPAISVPCGKPSGLPVGLMLIGRHFDDAGLLNTAYAFESNVEWENLT